MRKHEPEAENIIKAELWTQGQGNNMQANGKRTTNTDVATTVKTILTCCGGIRELASVKKLTRELAGLSAVPDEGTLPASY